MTLARFQKAAKSARSWSQRYRWPLTLAGALVLIGGVAWSLSRLEFDVARLQPAYLVLVASVLVPASIAVAAINLEILGKVVGTSIPISNAVAVTAYGRVAELLPIPGAALARGAALMQSGANLAQTTSVLIWSSLMTLAMVALFACYPLAQVHAFLGVAVGGAGILGLLLTGAWFLSRSNARIVGAMVGLRFVNVAIGVLRFWACFAAIGFGVPMDQAAVFVIASSITTYIGIVPGGLGISEILSASLALLIDIDPLAAFLAAAVDRIVGLAISGLVALIMISVFMKKPRKTT